MRRAQLLIATLLPVWLSAQVLVSGTMVGKEQQPLPYVTIAFQSLEDTSRLEGVFSSSDGSFELTLPSGSYAATFQMLGFERLTKQAVLVHENVDFGKIILHEEVEQLEEVVVRADRSYVETDLGKKTLYIGSD